MARPKPESKSVRHNDTEKDATQGRRGTLSPRKKDALSLYPLSLEAALRAAIATGSIPQGDRKPKPKRRGK